MRRVYIGIGACAYWPFHLFKSHHQIEIDANVLLNGDVVEQSRSKV